MKKMGLCFGEVKRIGEKRTVLFSQKLMGSNLVGPKWWMKDICR
jgi:hypothetical protein